MPKWAAHLISVSGVSISLLLAIIGFFSIRTLDSIETELKNVKQEIKSMNADYGRMAQSVAVLMAVNETRGTQCRFPKNKQEKN